MEVKAALTSSLGRTILGSSIVTIGRALDNGLVVSDPRVSSHHAEIRPDGQGYSIVDLGSTNGTFVNGQRLIKNTSRLLHSGDTIRIDAFPFTYEEDYPTPWGDDTNATKSGSGYAACPLPSPSIAGNWDEEEEGGQHLMFPPAADYADVDISSTREEGGQLLAVPPASPSLPQAPLCQPPLQVPYMPPVSIDSASYGQSAPPTADTAQEHLQFTAFHTRVVPVETWNTLLVYAYIESALEAVRADAYRFRDQLGPNPFKADAWASRPLTRGIQITVVPTFQGVTFSPERIAFNWVKDWHPAVFSFNADKRWAGAVGSGEIIVFAGPLIIASLKISLRFGEQSFQDNSNQEEVPASRYRKIFTSYSHEDTPIVLAIRKAYEVMGDDSFLDVKNLRSGQNWNMGLLKMIDNCDIFQLFWSERSAQSPYVYQECQYALQHSKYDGFIRPVYWEKPLRSPPPELSHLHFAYYELPKKNSFFSHFFGIFKHE